MMLIFIYPACHHKPDREGELFELMPSSHTGVDFANHLEFDENVNPYTFRNFYNGAGVAVGDVNNDGLVDLFFASNQGQNKLYLNKGNFKFEDITESAGVGSQGVWSTGVSMADVNGDGWVDIYVCKSGPPGGDQRHNQLWINNGDGTFTDKSREFGLAEEGLSQHAVFFDYDLDGDLDMYLLSNSMRSVGINDLREGQRDIRDPLGGNKLFRNDNGHFTDISEEAGIYGSEIGYGLGVTVADLDKDGWPDLYVSNDFFERDYLYMNNGDGSFRECLEEVIMEISMGAMGADIADINNDGWADIFVTEMLPATWDRVKTKTPFEDWDKYQTSVKSGYYHQFTRNTLQLNLGPKPSGHQVHFSEIARLTNTHATDWSWGALIFDADNDGHKDIFVANGIAKDLTDFDYVDFYAHDTRLIAQMKKDSVLLTNMIKELPSEKLPNYFFHNLGDLQFDNKAEDWGLNHPTFSNGAVYADLDNDGDLDLIVSNINAEAMIFQNHANSLTSHHFLCLDTQGNFGVKLEAFAGDQYFYQEHYPVKGYMSSMDHRLFMGLGNHSTIDSLKITWPDGRMEIQYQITSNQTLNISPEDAHLTPVLEKNVPPLFTSTGFPISFTHKESEFVDFDRDRLRFFMVSNEGPAGAVADVNGNGLDDLFVTGAKGQSSQLFLQQGDGTFKPTQSELFATDSLAEDVAVAFFDATNNGHPDIYVGSGGIEFGNSTPIYQDRLYINDGQGNFQKTEIPIRFQSTSFVVPWDFNGDGLIDLVIGTRAIPFGYGMPVGLSLLENTGGAKFRDITRLMWPELKEIGLTRDGKIGDLDGDGQDELVVVGEWMGIKVFQWKDGKLIEISEQLGLEGFKGLWQSVELADYSGNGCVDILAGNYGLNTRLKASVDQPIRTFINDFDQNGSVEHIITIPQGDEHLPVVLKNDLIKQIPSLRRQLPRYVDYKDKTLEELFDKDILEKSLILEVQTLETTLFENDGKGNFRPQILPNMMQSSPIYSILPIERNPVTEPLVMLGGNQSRIKPELGSQMGNYGMVFQNSFQNGFDWIPPKNSGVYIRGEIRDLIPMTIAGEIGVLVLKNNAAPEWLKMNIK